LIPEPDVRQTATNRAAWAYVIDKKANQVLGLHGAIQFSGPRGQRRRLRQAPANIGRPDFTDRSDPKSRLRLLETNAEIYRDIVPRLVHAAPHAVILVVTDPPDPLADIARANVGHDRVLSTGTFLDSLRFRVHLAKHFEVDANQVEAQVIGEHGVSQVFLWSSARIAGVPISTLVEGSRRNARDGAPEDRAGRSLREYRNIEGNDASHHRHRCGADRGNSSSRRTGGHTDRKL
jgi:hypothetical protein